MLELIEEESNCWRESECDDRDHLHLIIIVGGCGIGENYAVNKIADGQCYEYAPDGFVVNKKDSKTGYEWWDETDNGSNLVEPACPEE